MLWARFYHVVMSRLLLVISGGQRSGPLGGVMLAVSHASQEGQTSQEVGSWRDSLSLFISSYFRSSRVPTLGRGVFWSVASTTWARSPAYAPGKEESLEEVVGLLIRVGIQGTSSQFVDNHVILE